MQCLSGTLLIFVAGLRPLSGLPAQMSALWSARNFSKCLAAARTVNCLETVYVLLISIGNVQYQNQRSAVRYVPGTFDGMTFVPKAVPGAIQNGSNYWLQDYDFGPDTYATAFWFEQSAGLEDTVHSISWATQVTDGYAWGTPTDVEGWRHTMTTARSHYLDTEYRLRTLPASTETLQSVTIFQRENVSTIDFSYDDALRAANPALEFTWTLRAARSELPCNDFPPRV